MIRKLTIILLLLALGLTLNSCATVTARKHLEKGKELDKRGAKVSANKEYIRALKGITDRSERGRISKEVADNFRKAHKFEEAIKYYRESIENKNYLHLPAPYVKLADTYIVSDQTGAAAQLLEELEEKKPENYKSNQAEIARMLGAYYMRKGDKGKAGHYFKLFRKYAREMNDEGLVRTAERLMKLVGLEVPKEEKEGEGPKLPPPPKTPKEKPGQQTTEKKPAPPKIP